MRPRIEWLETFLVIVDCGSLTRTGERIGRTQSAVSLQLRQLEDCVGAPLFQRHARHMSLTAAGERLVPLAQRAVDAAWETTRALRGHERRVVRIGVPEEYADRLVPGLLRDLARREPDLAVEVQCAASASLEQWVRRDRLDAALALAEEVRSRGEPVAVDPVPWLTIPGSIVSHRRPLPVALFDHACSWRDRAMAALEAAGVDFRIVFTSASVAGIRAGIRAGIAVGVLAESTAGDGLEPVEADHGLPALPPTELILLSGKAAGDDAGIFVRSARAALTG